MKMIRLSAQKTGRCIFLLCTMFSVMSHAQDERTLDPYANETKEERDARMDWWREARFGMFIHWGVYAVPAGVHNGKEITRNNGEWIMHYEKIPVDEYKEYAKQFNPVKYDPVAWARLAKEAGMRYMVITSKHHDGFALFPSDVTDWDIADASPYGKDLIGPLADAARDEGLHIGFYYSHAQDWVNPGGAKRGFEEGDGWDEMQKGDYDAYLDNIAAPQVKEILTRYKPDILWWDFPVWMNKKRADRLIPLIRLAPGIITNDRLGGGYKGDTDTPEQHIPATGFKNRDWEVCMTMNKTWGYKSFDHNWKSSRDLIQKLCDIVSKGGNFLLNVGPTAEGEIPQPSVERLKAIGAWMDVNGESIYGTTASPFHRLTWGRCTRKDHSEGTTLYLQVFDWPSDGKLLVPGLKNRPKSIQLLQSGAMLNAQSIAGETPGIAIEVPANAPDRAVSVIKLEIEGELDVEAVMPEQDSDGTLKLEPVFADLHNRFGTNLQLENTHGESHIGQWSKSGAWVSWTFLISRPGQYRVTAKLSSEKDSKVTWNLAGKKKNDAMIEATGGFENYEVRELGIIDVKEAGTYSLEIRPDKEGWNPIQVRSVNFDPVIAR